MKAVLTAENIYFVRFKYTIHWNAWYFLISKATDFFPPGKYTAYLHSLCVAVAFIYLNKLCADMTNCEWICWKVEYNNPTKVRSWKQINRIEKVFFVQLNHLVFIKGKGKSVLIKYVHENTFHHKCMASDIKCIKCPTQWQKWGHKCHVLLVVVV